MEMEAKGKMGTDIPKDVLIDILSRFHAMFVWNLRSVCKHWKSIIEASSFADLYHSRSKEKFIMFGVYNHPYYKTRFYSIDKQDGNAVQVVQDEIVNPIMNTTSTSSINGLLCYLGTDQHINVCNPVTYELITLPKPTFFLSSPSYLLLTQIGFDSTLKSYKVLAVKGKNLSEVEIFTLGETKTKSSWRKVQIPSSVEINLLQNRFYVNGCVYWFCGNGEMKNALMAFNFAEEKFEFVPLPPHVHVDTLNDDYWMGELEGCFCLVEAIMVDQYIFRGRKRVRLMKLVNSGTQPWVEQHIALPHALKDISSVFPISSGVMLVERNFSEKYICHYNEEGRVLKSIQVHGIPHGFQPRQFHSETLVSWKRISAAES